MKRWLKRIVWIYEFNDGNQVEVSLNDKNELEYIKPLLKSIGIIFYLNYEKKT